MLEFRCKNTHHPKSWRMLARHQATRKTGARESGGGASGSATGLSCSGQQPPTWSEPQAHTALWTPQQSSYEVPLGTQGGKLPQVPEQMKDSQPCREPLPTAVLLWSLDAGPAQWGLNHHSAPRNILERRQGLSEDGKNGNTSLSQNFPVS